jgi:hypothetical protein
MTARTSLIPVPAGHHSCQPIENYAATSDDFRIFGNHTEVHCPRFGGHFYHIFSDRPIPTGKQHFIMGCHCASKLEPKDLRCGLIAKESAFFDLFPSPHNFLQAVFISTIAAVHVWVQILD